MSIESEILRIQHNIANTYAVVSDMGGEVPLQPNSDNLPKAARSIPQGPTYTAGDGIDIVETETGAEISVILPTKTVTQEEYDALTDEQKQADVLYLVDEPPWTPAPLSIQEYDTEDGWHVRKWSDGYAELSKEVTQQAGTWHSLGGGRYYSDSLASPEFPFALTAKYQETVSMSDMAVTSGALVHFETVPSSNGSMGKPRSYWLISTQTDIASFGMRYYVCGRWK